MTKKTLTVYSMLFLFAFTFAFALAMEASAEGTTCCPYEICEDGKVGRQGHIYRETCVFDGLSYCDRIFECAGPPPN